jgi:hydrogenase maturation protease
MTLPIKTLVIGYGNSLRGDDGVGPLVAEQVAAWNLPDVRSLSVHQLTPELAAEIAQVEQVFFIDAKVVKSTQSPPDLGDLGGECKAVQPSLAPTIRRLTSTPSSMTLDHTWSPSALLHLAQTLYHATPIAYQILIPSIQFDYGESLSAIAKDGLAWSFQTLKTYFADSLVADQEEQRCMKSA